MNRRDVLGMAAGATAAVSVASATAIAEPVNDDRPKKEYVRTRKEYKFFAWSNSHHGDPAKLFNEMSVAGWDYLECTFCDGVNGQYIFQRRTIYKEIA